MNKRLKNIAAEALVRAIMDDDNISASKKLETILKEKCAKKIADAHKT